jgi:hypothetical protein
MVSIYAKTSRDFFAGYCGPFQASLYEVKLFSLATPPANSTNAQGTRECTYASPEGVGVRSEGYITKINELAKLICVISIGKDVREVIFLCVAAMIRAFKNRIGV